MDVGDYIWMSVISLLGFTSTALLIYHGWDRIVRVLRWQEERFDRVLNQQLLLDVSPRLAMVGTIVAMVMVGALTALIGESWFLFFIGAAPMAAAPHVVVSHLQEKRRKRLDEQVVDGITSLASGVRAGLNLVQSIQLLVTNATGPIREEFAQLMREYDLGVDLNTAMHNASNRIGSSYYRLLFAAIAAHRDRGGDMGQSLDRIADSIREIQRLEGRLESMTAQGRAQANFMAVMPIIIVILIWMLIPDAGRQLIDDPIGRLILLTAIGLVTVGFLWIRRIMSGVDI